jgi:6-pyruvoyltetrahydropterin/6-carboxytetrahydropterin synthase
MTVTRKVSVGRNRLRFAAAHMATFNGGCEPIHGHNYDVTVELEGDLTADHWVWDFGELKRATRELTEQLDHKFILQRDSIELRIDETATNWKISFGGKGYVLPKDDVIALPIPNSTVECIAEWMSDHLQQWLTAAGAGNVRKLAVGVEEMPGQAGWYTVEL